MKIEGVVAFCLKASRRKFPNKAAESLMIQAIHRVKTRAVDLASLPEFEEQLDKFMEDTLMERMNKGQTGSLTCKLCVNCIPTFLSLSIQNLNDLLP